ncbi:hypothetical protein DFH11DRAFT_1824379 [Phellopilus nigrolimitatus]|nr:hypothetical protein DFH11DRAFT_1824379 [Phellopilus nigrolimitatus]
MGRYSSRLYVAYTSWYAVGTLASMQAAAPDLERAPSASSRSSSRAPARPPTPAHPRQHWWSRPGSGGAACTKSTGAGAGVDAAPGLAPLASLMSRDAARALGAAALRSVPAVLLGVLLNVFPAFGGVGISMFFVTYHNARSTIIAQLAYSCGASGFAGANGSMMIEVVPVRTSEHMAVLGVSDSSSLLPSPTFILGALVFGALTMNGWIAPWTGRFYSLWDTGCSAVPPPRATLAKPNSAASSAAVREYANTQKAITSAYGAIGQNYTEMTIDMKSHLLDYFMQAASESIVRPASYYETLPKSVNEVFVTNIAEDLAAAIDFRMPPLLLHHSPIQLGQVTENFGVNVARLLFNVANEHKKRRKWSAKVGRTDCYSAPKQTEPMPSPLLQTNKLLLSPPRSPEKSRNTSPSITRTVSSSSPSPESSVSSTSTMGKTMGGRGSLMKELDDDEESLWEGLDDISIADFEEAQESIDRSYNVPSVGIPTNTYDGYIMRANQVDLEESPSYAGRFYMVPTATPPSNFSPSRQRVNVSADPLRVSRHASQQDNYEQQQTRRMPQQDNYEQQRTRLAPQQASYEQQQTRRMPQQDNYEQQRTRLAPQQASYEQQQTRRMPQQDDYEQQQMRYVDEQHAPGNEYQAARESTTRSRKGKQRAPAASQARRGGYNA